MKKHYRIYLLFAIVAMTALLAACSGGTGGGRSRNRLQSSDLEYVKAKGSLVVGITDFVPMDYQEGDSWVGFDADLAEAFARELGVSLKFKEIDWDKKTELLRKGTIDCIWNGMTETEELKQTISCSDPYLSNAQVVVLRKSEGQQYQTLEACQHLLFAVETGSTGEALLKEKKFRYTAYPTQLEALQSVRDRKTDAAVIDVIMADCYTGEGQEFEELGFTIALNDEVLCVGFRKESDLTEKANEFMAASYQDGTIASLAEKYGIESAVLEQDQ